MEIILQLTVDGLLEKKIAETGEATWFLPSMVFKKLLLNGAKKQGLIILLFIIG